MSTSYYRLRQPITYLRLEPGPGHDRLNVWVSHGLAATFVIRPGDTPDILRMFAVMEEADNECPLRTYWGGDEKGTVVVVNDGTLPDEAQVISERSELLTVAEVKSRAGAKRADGTPTELFGYE